MESPKQKRFVDGRTSLTSSPVVRLPPSSSPGIKTQTPARSHTKWNHYDAQALKAIGRLCGDRLPPASSVQAMFLYEMHRETEQERLFHSQMFELARAKDHCDAQQARMTALEQQIATMQRQMRSKDTDDRLATSRVRMDAQQAKINEQSLRINDFDKYVRDVQQRVEDLSTESNLYNRLANGHTTLLTTYAYSLEDVKAEIERLKASDATRDSQIASVSGQIQQLEQNDQAAMKMFEIQHANIQSAHLSIQEVKISFESSGVKNLKDVNFANVNVKNSVDETESILKGLNSDMTGLEQEIKALITRHDVTAGDVAETKAACTAIQATSNAFDENIGVLFDERNVLIATVDAACTRIEKLEGTVRALTGQTASSLTSTAGNSPQIIPVRSASGQTFDLAVPKGSSLVEYRKANGNTESNKPIRSFVPGKQWEGG